MSTSEERIAHQLRLGHPEADGYAPPSFSAVLAHREAEMRRSLPGWFAPLAAVAVVVVAVVAVASLAGAGLTPGMGGFSSVVASPTAPRLTPETGGLSSADRHAIAVAAGVDDLAVLATDGGAVATRWRDGRVELLRASRGQGWTITVVNSVEAPRPPGAAASAMGMITCLGGAARPSFVFGLFKGMTESHLGIHGVDGIGGDLSGGTFVFAVAAQPGSSFWIDGPNDPRAPSSWPTAPGVPVPAHPGAYFSGQISAAVTCPRF